MLPSISTTIFLIFSLIFCSSMVYYVNRVITYKVDERGLTILTRASTITFGTLLLFFALFLLYIVILDIFDLNQINQRFSLIFIRNSASFVMALIGVVNALSIRFFENRM